MGNCPVGSCPNTGKTTRNTDLTRIKVCGGWLCFGDLPLHVQAVNIGANFIVWFLARNGYDIFIISNPLPSVFKRSVHMLNTLQCIHYYYEL